MLPLPVTTQTAYAELVEQLVALDASRSVGHLRGGFVTKKVRGGTYYYFQHSEPGGVVKQEYVGRRSRELDALVRRFEAERESVNADRARINELCAVLRAGGAGVTDTASARVISAISDASVFKLGGLLVGTHAFVVLGNVLGIRWAGGATRTEDVDVAVERRLEIGLPIFDADIPAVVERLGMGSQPIPSLSPRSPSTSFKVRGKGLRLDLVTPAKGDDRGPVTIARLGAAAAPVRYLELLLEDAQPAAVVNGGGVLVNVPHPASFAVHKLLVAQDRPAAFQTKSNKDVAQAAQLIEALEELRPGEVRAAWVAARRRGRRWVQATQRGATMLGKSHAAAHRILLGR